MKIVRFDIKNFKGISHARIGLDDEIPGNVSTLIGLNESGKTTILEALSHFVTEDKDTAGLVGTVTKTVQPQDLIPKDMKAAFTGIISIEATVRISESDIDALYDHLIDKMSIYLEKSSVNRTITVDKSYKFVDSNHENTQNLWTLGFNLKKKREKKYKFYNGTASESKEKREIWIVAVEFLKKRIPKIVYFPTFLFDFPDRIYLEKDEKEVNGYYSQVIQDVMDSDGSGLSIQKHINDRISKVKLEMAEGTNIFAALFQRDEKKQIDAVLQKVSHEMSRVIFGSWNQILGKNVIGKRVEIDWSLDDDKNHAPYLEIYIVDGQSKYSISERSLGFRWFFSFLLFTQFRINRKDDSDTVFLFDEPAANLHSKAQMKLLESFSRIAHDQTHVIYSTHSHYMVNPLWLEKAYIIENKATDYDDGDDVGSFAVRKTNISAVPYRKFVGSNPTKTTYFQPVLDALNVAFSPLLRSSQAVIVEGKNDFYALLYLRKQLTASLHPEIFPSNGAAHSGVIISLFRGWGVNFKLILDDDNAGKQAKRRYMNDFFLTNEEVVTLGEISGTLEGKEFEDIYQKDIISIVKTRFSVAKPTKHHYALFFQQIMASKESISMPETLATFKPISDWIDSSFAEQ